MFMGKGRCAVCHVPQTAFMDNNMHDLNLERFYNIGQTANDLVMSPDGPINPSHCDTAWHQGRSTLFARWAADDTRRHGRVQLSLVGGDHGRGGFHPFEKERPTF